MKFEGTELRFEFKGKSGKVWRLRLRDRRIAKVVRARQELPASSSFSMSIKRLEVVRMEPTWTSSGPTLGPLWTSSGPSLDRLWTFSGPSLYPFWTSSRPSLDPLWTSASEPGLFGASLLLLLLLSLLLLLLLQLLL